MIPMWLLMMMMSRHLDSINHISVIKEEFCVLDRSYCLYCGLDANIYNCSSNTNHDVTRDSWTPKWVW